MDAVNESSVLNSQEITGQKAEHGKHPNSLANLRSWKPGESGNPMGKHKTGPQLARLAREFLATVNPVSGKLRAEEFVEKVVTLAYNGDPVAMKLVWNYVEGMPTESAEVVVKTEVDLGIEYLRGIIEERRKKLDEPIALPSISDQRQADQTDGGTD